MTRAGRGGAVLLSLLLWLHAAAAAELVMEPLAPRSGPRGATMFHEMPAAQTGVVIDNPYDDPRMWQERYQELVYGALGTGVAVGDYDQDGRPDIFVVRKTGGGRLFRNLGGWKFEDVTTKAGLDEAAASWTDKARGWLGLGGAPATAGEWCEGVTWVDVDNDGWLDLYICRFGAPNLLYMNQHDGTFREEAAARGLALVDASVMAAFGDFNRDGWLDVYVQTNLLDAATHPGGQPDHLFKNNGDGTFTDVTARAGLGGETSGHSALWWDYDGDGWPDLFVSNDYSVPDRLYRNNRDGTFTDVIDQVVPHQPYYSMGADIGDVNNDGLIDLLAADMAPTTHEKDQRGMALSRMRAQLPPSRPGEAPQYMRNALYLNTGLGRMQEGALLAGVAATDWTWSVRFEDLDNDGRLDLHVTNGMLREFHNADLLDRIMAGESQNEARRTVRVSPVLAETNLAFRNRGHLQFEEVGAAWGLDQKGVSFGAAFGDFDGDGDLDLVFANLNGGPTLLRNDSDSGHRLIVDLRGVRSNRFGIGAEVRIETASGVQVRELTLARGLMSSSEPMVHFGLGDDDLVRRLTVKWPSGARQIFENLPVDRRFTITEPGPNGGTPAALVPDTPPATQFAPVPQAPAGSAPIQSAPPLMAAGDFNHDGLTDTFVAGVAEKPGVPLAAPSALWLGRAGGREDVTAAMAPALKDLGLVTCAVWADLDGDGWADLVVTEDWGRVRYFHNRAGQSLDERTESSGFARAGTGRWSAVAVGDVNGDGRLDLALGNLGLNTRYQASPTEPSLLWYGDFGAREPFAVEAYYEAGRLYPFATRRELADRIRPLLRRFPKNDDYARATLEEILGRDALDHARRFAVTELRSGLLLSQPDGRYVFEPLPREAQIAPIVGWAVADFDADGALDLFALENSFAAPPSVGRFDGGVGQWLRGDGRGGFAPAPPVKSGLVVPGEPRTVRVIDPAGDGWPGLAVAMKDGSALAFRNRGVAGHQPLRIVLPAGEACAGTIIRAAYERGGSVAVVAAEGDDDCFLGRTPGNPIRALTVRWPDGRETTVAVAPAQTVVRLSRPPG